MRYFLALLLALSSFGNPREINWTNPGWTDGSPMVAGELKFASLYCGPTSGNPVDRLSIATNVPKISYTVTARQFCRMTILATKTGTVGMVESEPSAEFLLVPIGLGNPLNLSFQFTSPVVCTTKCSLP